MSDKLPSAKIQTSRSGLLLPPGYKRGMESIRSDCNEIHIHEGDDERQAKVEQWIAKKIGTKLMQAYPNRQWKVIVDIPGGMLIIACDSVSNSKGYHIRLDKTIDELEKSAIMAAGEILERHQLSRSRHFDADILETLDRDFLDNVIAPDSRAEPA